MKLIISPYVLLRTGKPLLLVLALLLSWIGAADEFSARQAMENSQHPLVLIDTSQGDIFVELFADEAPRNVANFLALATGQQEIRDAVTGQSYFPNYYDGMRFHRVIPGYLVQAGSPAKNPYGIPGPTLPDEINATFLGLDVAQLILPDGSLNPLLNIGDRNTLEDELLLPLFRQMRIANESNLEAQQFAVADRLRNMTIKQLYELLGYHYEEIQATHPVSRGVLALANQGPDSNGPEFFIPVADAHWLNGRYTVIGQVIEGMEIVDRIARFAVDPLSNSRQSTLIFSVRPL